MFCARCGAKMDGETCPNCDAAVSEKAVPGGAGDRRGVQARDIIMLVLWLIGLPVKLFFLVLSVFVKIPGLHRSYSFRDLVLGSAYTKKSARVSIMLNAVLTLIVVLLVFALRKPLWDLFIVPK